MRKESFWRYMRALAPAVWLLSQEPIVDQGMKNRGEQAACAIPVPVTFLPGYAQK